ncbi:MAG: PAS domain S-box protein, partial [Thermoleophilia bacterium]|nr:PAS domain S-box protein [Thermoleophilia bacterium]
EELQKALREAEERYRALIDNTPSVIFSVDAHGVITAVNKNFVQLTELAPAEAEGRTLEEAGLPGEVATQWRALLEELLKTGRNIRTETTAILPDERLHILEVSLVPIRDAQGRIAGARGRVADVTEHREALQALQESEERFRAFIEQAPLAIRASREGKTIYANRRFLRLFGYDTLSEILGRPIIEQFAPAERPR